MGLLSIFNRKKTTADTSRPTGRGAGKTRSAARSAPAAAMAAPTDTAEAVREARARARRRLMGATVLLLIGVIGFPLLFETQPRPIPVDLPIEIPARNAPGSYETGAVPTAHGGRGASGGAMAAAMPPVPASAATADSVSYDVRPSAPPNAAPRTTIAAAPAQAVTPLAADLAKPAVVAASKPSAAAPTARPVAPAHPVAADPAPAPSASSTAAAAAMLEVANPAVDRYIVQVAAFKPTDDAKIRDVRGRVEKLGLKTYTQPVDTPAGKWIRVRIGPYPTKAEADSAVAKIAAAGLGLQPKVYMP